MFDPSFSFVALIEKLKPEWQRGKLNGIGGKVEEKESAAQAMAREFREETGIETNPDDWRRVAGIHEPGVTVDVFACVHTEICRVESTTDEQVGIWSVKDYGLYADTIPNLRWMIPMCQWALQKKTHMAVDMLGGLS